MNAEQQYIELFSQTEAMIWFVQLLHLLHRQWSILKQIHRLYLSLFLLL